MRRPRALAPVAPSVVVFVLASLVFVSASLVGCSSGGGKSDAGPDGAAPDFDAFGNPDTGDVASVLDTAPGTDVAPVSDASVADTAADRAEGDAADAAPVDANPGPEVPTAIQVPLASAPAVDGGWRARCIAAADSTTLTDTCWVIAWHQWTYWPMSNVDNRASLNIVAVDAAGNLGPGGGDEKQGSRYVWLASVDQAAMTVTFHTQGDVDITLSWDELLAGMPITPHIVLADAASGPTYAGGWSTRCFDQPDDTMTSSTCRVLRWGRWTYWTLSNADNRSSTYILAVDDSGTPNPAGGLEKTGIRYVATMIVDPVDQTVTYIGQANATVTVTFDELHIDQH